ncbi:hypothetical protein GGR58DRAFT_503691 [Xylaria digitata]|nr:hypothetical protein GGR58DRAFT_503691 [Xylaria digitata]
MAPNQLPVILHLVPVITSTSSLWYAWDQYEQMTVFCQPELKGLSNQTLPQYFTLFFNRGVPRVLGLLATTALSCTAILRYSSSALLREQGAFRWYVAGFSLAVGQMAWAPSVLPPVRAIEHDAKDKNVSQLEKWLRLHVWRSLPVDIGAWICCVVATSKSLS